LSAWLQDLSFAIRGLVKRPGFALVTICVLAIAIGANTVIFSLLDAYVVKPLPYPASDRLVAIYNVYPNMGLDNAGVSIPDYLDRRAEAPSLESTAIYNVSRRVLSDADRREQLLVARASPSLFEVLATAPAIGRAFTEAEAVPGEDRVIVLSHRLWASRFGGAADVVGRDIRLDGEPFRVAGVMPEGFGFPSQAIDAWVPFAFTARQMSDEARGQEYSQSIGRLALGATIEGLNAEMDAIVERSLAHLPGRRAFIETSGFTGRAESLHALATRNVSVLLYLLQALVLAVLLIACANIANLQLARMTTRRQELSIRTALGASAGRIARLVVSESFVLAAIGALSGLALCYPALGLLEGLLPRQVAPGTGFGLDTNVLLFTLGTVIVATIVTGLLPLAALRRADLVSVIKDFARTGVSRSAHRVRGALVVFQIAVSVALLVTAGLLTKSFYRLTDSDPGFERSGLWTASLVLPQSRYADEAGTARLNRQVLDELVAIPGVSTAAYTSSLPLIGTNAQSSYAIEGMELAEGQASPHAQQRSISEGFLPALGVQILQGRNFRARETEPVVLVDELFVRRYFPDGDVLGKRVRIDEAESAPWYTIIGVAAVVHHDSLAANPSKETIYWHYAQRPEPGGQIVLKTSLPPEQLTPAATATLAGIDRDAVLSDPASMESVVLQSLGQENAARSLTVLFAAAALALAVLGIYGVLTFAVSQRVGEIGLRMALGARASHVVSMVLEQSGRFIAWGLVVGVALAAAFSAVLSSEIYEVSPADPGVFAMAIGSIVLASLLASWLPARRAARVDPMTALREE
jgi:predicted permease